MAAIVDDHISEQLSPTAVDYVIRHVFLPPRLPQEDDFEPDGQAALIRVTAKALAQFRDVLPDHDRCSTVAATQLLESMERIHLSSGDVCEIELREELAHLHRHGTSIVLHIRAQNAGVIVSRRNDAVFFEAFELSPTNEAVMTTRGRLRRHFPAHAVRIGLDVFHAPGFQNTVAETLATMSHQNVTGTLPRARKAGRLHDEDRDTRHPGLVTELFMGFLGSMGEMVPVVALTKHTREEVLWCEARSPWRRSPLWLLIRVALQLHFAGSKSRGGGLYKAFMVLMMSTVLRIAPRFVLDNDTLYAMQAKLVRRRLKIGAGMPVAVDEQVDAVVLATEKELVRRWREIQAHDAVHLDLPRLRTLDVEQDTWASLPKLDEHIRSIARWDGVRSRIPFEPLPRLVRYATDTLPNLQDADVSDDEYGNMNLLRFERWVTTSLAQWVKTQTGAESCEQLRVLLVKYYTLAQRRYARNPEGLSIAILISMQLWVACDTAAIRSCPLISDYRPGIAVDLLQNLVLPFREDLQTLQQIEKYLAARVARALHSLFLGPSDPNCFAARYFERSVPHQELLSEINTWAQRRRNDKRAELVRLKNQYTQLMKQWNEDACEFHKVTKKRHNALGELRKSLVTEHMPGCRRCGYRSTAANLKVDIDEWPLPGNHVTAKAVVFELQVPVCFAAWREATVYLLTDVLRSVHAPATAPRASNYLSNDRHLHDWFAAAVTNLRIGLLSEDKPHVGTHRTRKDVATATEPDVCLANGLRYNYYDNHSGCFVDAFQTTDDVPHACTYQLPKQAAALQRFIFRPAEAPSGPPPNAVIASQADCPAAMSLEEYQELGGLALGNRLQWWNLLGQLAAPTIDFKKPETALMVWQCIYQAGPARLDDVLRQSHADAGNDDFATAVLEVLHEALERIRGNWESASALGVMATVATRVLSLSSTLTMQRSLLSFLAVAREVCFEWVRSLRDRTQNAVTQEERTELMSKCVEVALIGTTCFDVESHHLFHILETPEPASVLVQTAMVLRDGRRTLAPTPGSMLQILHWRFQRLLHRSYLQLARDPRGLDDAVRQTWSAYRAGTSWQVVSEAVDYWLVTHTEPTGGGDAVAVQYNLLTGELLVDGHPLDRLPREFEDCPLYATLFGRSAVEVLPSTAPGMRFSTKRAYDGFVVHLGLDGRANLRVQASKADQVYHTVPARVFCKDYPTHFVNDCVHWYHVNEGTVQFRPLCDPWNASAAEWTLYKRAPQAQWQLRQERVALAALRTTSAKVVGEILSPLAGRARIHVRLPFDGSPVTIDIPTLQLAFSLRPGGSALESKQFPGQCVDADQAVGCVVGLCNKLVLQHGTNGSRMVLVPEGPATYTRNPTTNHVQVHVATDCVAVVHSFQVDGDLGQLKDNGSVHSTLFLAFLHALTSFCLPDPLLCKTGTERAISILTSAAVQSYEQLTQEDVALLEMIACLTPNRAYYPANERVMQIVQWSNDLGSLSQHPGLYQAVEAILNQMTRSRMFYPERVVTLPHFRMVPFLLERDCIRSSTFRVAGFGAEAFTSGHDVSYRARDRAYDSPRQSSAYAMSSVIYRQQSTLHWRSASREELWQAVSQLSSINGADADTGRGSDALRYDGALLSSEDQIFPRWLTLHRRLDELRSMPAEKFHVMLWLASLAFHEHADTGALQTLALCYSADAIRQIALPPGDSFCPEKGYTATLSTIQDLLRHAMIPYPQSPEAKLARLPYEEDLDFDRRRESAFHSKSDRAQNDFAKAILTQWPCDKPSTPTHNTTEFTAYLDVQRAMNGIQAKFKTWFDNRRLYRYFGEIEEAARRLVHKPVNIASGSLKQRPAKTNMHRFVSTEELFARPAPSLAGVDEIFEMGMADNLPSQSSAPLSALIQTLRGLSGSTFERAYVDGLEKSHRHLQQRGAASNSPADWDAESLRDYRQQCKARVSHIYQILERAVQSEVPTSCAPRISHACFLEQLGARRWRGLSGGWRACIVAYGRAVAALQRADRIVRALATDDNEAVASEMRNVGHRNWNPLEYPDSLLLEVESGITIRDVQEEIAAQMRTPPSGRNAVMQLNMGEGKSSVIIPMVAAALADGTRLVRVVVPKPQSRQMAHVLRSKLSGLLHRPIYFMPFSRALQLNESGVATIAQMCRDCMKQGGVVLLQPENILSFELMGLDYRLSGRSAMGQALWDVQTFLDQHARDIVDESDENFSVKFELVYTMGAQRPIEMTPHRWIVIQQVLDLVCAFAPNVAQAWQSGLEVTHRETGSFPRIRIIRREAGEDLFRRVAEHICSTGLDGFPIARQPPEIRDDVCAYITHVDLSRESAERVEGYGERQFWTDGARATLLLLRGLLAGGVLAFVLGQKRWRVHYGLAPSRVPRTRLAVPYRAKDIPAPRSEFSHPDVLIALTSMCCYYEGLQDEELFTAFGHLLRSDQSDLEYRAWVQDAPRIPREFKQLQGINLRDRRDCVERVFPFLRTAKSVVDYYLCRIVFPKEMRGFPHKLSTSGWDLGKIKQFPTTGFSGTNDARALLPLDVGYVDLPTQTCTNALVLHYLLQPENSVALLDPPDDDCHLTDAERLLSVVMSLTQPVHVILDVGAQILELDNRGVAETWLKMQQDDHVQAVVYFDVHNELSVVDRYGYVEPLQTSSFATRLHACLVYLDQAHTRGTDLKLPTNYRAAVTLGAQLTKDALVQACMRMRKLGKGQTVVFCIPCEVQTKIKACTMKPPGASIEITDVLIWAIEETYTDIRRSVPLWAVQGERFARHQAIRNESPPGEFPSQSQAERLLEDEMQSLEQRYGVYRGHEPSAQDQAPSDGYGARIAARCAEFEDLNIRSAALAEEQERELAPEIEEERQVQRAAPAKPAIHQLHRDLIRFVSDGVLVDSSKAYAPAFHALRDTSAAKHLDPSALSSRRLLASADFARTVQKDNVSFQSDVYQRSVRWVLTKRAAPGHEITHMVIISPYEAQELIASIRQSMWVALHLYKPRWNLDYRALDRLDFVVIPKPPMLPQVSRTLTIQLNLFAGQLYLGSFDDYRDTCGFLGLATKPAPVGWNVAADGFVICDAAGRIGAGAGLPSSPVEFLKVLTTKIRRHGEDIAKTHMGCLLDGKLLGPADFASVSPPNRQSGLLQ